MSKEYKCFLCGKLFTPKAKPSNQDRPFCSLSCSAKYNNSAYPKKKPVLRTECKFEDCTVEVIPYVSPFCTLHFKGNRAKLRTVESHQKLASSTGKHPSWVNSTIRQVGRAGYKNFFTECEICGYAKHVELAHIRPLSSWESTATMAEVHNINNVFGLCPNHHWEFDYGDLTEDEIWSKIGPTSPRYSKPSPFKLEGV